MNLLAWVLALTLMVLTMMESVAFYKSTVCRQAAWLKSTELTTRTLLHQPTSREMDFIGNCKIYVRREGNNVNWQFFPGFKWHKFQLELKGKL